MWNRGVSDPKRGSSRRTGRPLARLLRALDAHRAEFNPLDASDRPDESFESGWRKVVRHRAFMVLAVIALWGVSLQARLVFLQIVKHDEFLKKALIQQEDIVKPEAPRGDVVDRTGRPVAYSVGAQSIAVRPKLVKDVAKTIVELCNALRDCTADERKALRKSLSGTRPHVNVRWARNVSPEQVARVAERELPGIIIEPATRRYYPNGELAAHVLGFVGIDNTGLRGIEYAYNDLLKGEPGRAHVQVDALGKRLDTRVERAPVPGATVELTLDLTYQHIVERELRAGVEANRAKAGTAIMMNPYTGEIVAMASYPTFNPNNAWLAGDDVRRNRATDDLYEPGSTFKIITASAALEEHVVTPDEMIDTSPGWIKFAGRKPITESSGHNYGLISFAEAIIKSSNVGAIKVGLRTGAERLTKYVHRFGFGEALAPDFIGENKGLWNSSNLNDSGLASVSMGYQVGVTPLQMAMAASAVANGGLLMEPRVVRAIVRDGHREQVTPKVLRRAISPETAAMLTAMMEGVVDHGTATRAQLAGYRSAGKTGTAHKVSPTGGYSDSEYNASFVGFVPSREPAYTILVVIDTPRNGTHFGGTVAAPIFQKIAEAVVQRAGIAPSINPAPPVMLPAERTTLSTARVSTTTVLPNVLPAGGPALMPDVRGLSAREAARVLLGAGVRVTMEGQGFVARQLPLPGTPMDSARTSRLQLAREVRVSDVEVLP